MINTTASLPEPPPSFRAKRYHCQSQRTLVLESHLQSVDGIDRHSRQAVVASLYGYHDIVSAGQAARQALLTRRHFYLEGI